MPILLPFNDGEAKTSAAQRWQAFVARRDDLTAQMQMETCNGCDGCGLRCMDGFSVSRPEWEAVQNYLETLPPPKSFA